MTDNDSPSLDAAYNLKTTEANLKLYSDWASTYDEEFAGRSGYRFAKIIAEAYLEAGGMWPALDVGCGTGLVADYLPTSSVIDGIDISPEMLEQANAKGRYGELFEADLTKPIPLRDNSYIGVLSAGTFTHGHVGSEALSELMRVARPGAVFAISGNPTFYQPAGFKQAFERMTAGNLISEPIIREEPIYEAGAKPPEGHENDVGLVIVFNKL
ncbi:biotin biosynthesis protein BioC [Ruegeria denitrificans]|uniref:Biotin biosynthesis protein BioC n=1 Tax=Ruegeria denitrificans TaxID=1715692 RepID=A0A0P1IJS2_9RHOB|nr:class I SAM-dependent methyltransferase [Ruegeria denitrificans]CUK01981.1 biotin biosynthesis protein BioC [Ruegeria denitrificans]